MVHTTVRPVSTVLRTVRMTMAAARASSPLVGSSINITDGFATSSTAIVRRLHCSVESPVSPGSPTKLSRIAFSSTNSITSSTNLCKTMAVLKWDGRRALLLLVHISHVLLALCHHQEQALCWETRKFLPFSCITMPVRMPWNFQCLPTKGRNLPSYCPFWFPVEGVVWLNKQVTQTLWPVGSEYHSVHNNPQYE